MKLKTYKPRVILEYNYPSQMKDMWDVNLKMRKIMATDQRLRATHHRIINCPLLHVNNISFLCCPSYETLMRATNIKSRTTINRCLKNLISWQIIVKKKPNKGRANNYYFVIWEKDLRQKESTLESPSQSTFTTKQYTPERTLTNINYLNKNNDEKEYQYMKKRTEEGKIIHGSKKIHLIERLKEEGLNPKY